MSTNWHKLYKIKIHAVYLCLLMIVIDFKLLTECVCECVLLYRWTCRHKLRGPCSCRGPVLQLLLRSRRACHHLIHTSIRPPAHLSVTAGSPTSPAKPFISSLVQVSAGIWHTAHVRKRVKYRSARCSIVQHACVNVCLWVMEHCIFSAGRWQPKVTKRACVTLFVNVWHSFKGYNTTKLQLQLWSNAAAVLKSQNVRFFN